MVLVMRYITTIWLLLLSFSLVRAQGPKLKFTHISTEQGLSNSTIESIFQDSKGFMWFGTRDGLNRYDGYEMVVYRNNPFDSSSLSDSYIRYVYEDREQTVWVATINGLNRLNRAQNGFVRYKHRAADPGSLSNNLVTCLMEDRAGRLWVGTYGGGLCLLDKKTGKFTYYRHAGADAGSLSDDKVNTLYTDKAGNLWVGTASGLDLFQPATGHFTSYQNPASAGPSGNTINAIQEDRMGNLWLGTQADGLYLFDPLFKSFTRFAHSDMDPTSLGNNMVRTVLVDKKGHLWCGGINGGLNLFNPSRNAFFNYQNEPGNANSLSQRTISALFEDNQGNLWVGTHRGGVNVYTPGKEKFTLYRQEASPTSLSYNDVRTFCEDNNGSIWIGTDGGGLDLFLRDKHIFQHFRYDPFNAKSIGSDAVLDVRQDREGNLWVSTWGGGLNLLDRKTGSFIRYRHHPEDSNSISSDFVQQSFEDYEGKIWVATYYGGLNILDPKTKHFTGNVTDPSGKTHLLGKNIISINEDREGNIWIGTDDAGLNCYHQANRHFSHYFNNGEKMPDLRVLFCDSKGRLWVGQKGLYLLDAARDSFRIATTLAGLAEVFIKGITEDGQGNLWISTSDGLVQFNPENQSVKKYNTGDGLQDLEFEANAFLKTKDGEMYFGGINGFNCFYPGNIRPNAFVPPVYITGFQLFNKNMNAGEEGSPLQNDISVTREITLSYRQSTFSFTFAALNYTVSENNGYAYKLEGLDSGWNYVGKEKKASYTNIGPGDYTFRVKASNNDGVWNEEGASLRIIVRPPFWKTSWFLTLLGLSVVGLLYAFYKFRTTLKLREMEARQREEIRQVQLQFFTNISHEFRTPLSLILGPLEKIIKENPQPAFQHYYAIMHRNTQRLLSLINELMDFGKLESGSLKLGVMKGSLAAFLEELAEEFRDWAIQKEIHFTLNRGAVLQDTWFDRQVLEKIVLNLLQNSFKYTNAGGHITLEVLTTLDGFQPAHTNELVLKNKVRGSRYIYIRVADTGIGISAASIRHLFERYYRITDSHLGSGVGLAFVKSLATLHKGDVYVYSERLKGTEILIGIPISETDYAKEEKRGTNVPEGGVRLEAFEGRQEFNTERLPGQTGNTAAADAESAEEELTRDTGHKETLLLAEDHEELRSFLKDSLSPYYTVIEAVDGKDGLTKAREISPDLIISDVIMPGMNGLDFCKAIKQDIETSHIPFIMLTAKSALASQIEGLDAGADYYFPKPLNIDLLLLTVRNLLDQRAKLKERYTREYHVEAMDLVHTGKDKEFMSRLLEEIESQLSNPDFDIDYLCNRMGMSRTKLYQKIKNLSQQSIGDFIRTVRLKKAVQILTHEDVSLTEVMYRIGIQTQSYFTKAFKKEFGKTPTQFIQELRK